MNIVISNGKEQISVPDVVDLISADDAKSALEKVRLVLGKVTYRDSDKPAGSVISQTPSAGQLIDSGSTVAITVSSGKVQVPNVVSESKSQANTDLVNAGFKVQWIYTVDDTVPAGTVLAQTPQGGSMSVKGTTVTVQVSQLSDVTPSATPTVSLSPTPSLSATP